MASTPTVRPWPRLMGEATAAEYLSIGTTTLREQGPEPRRLGRRVLYDIQDLDRWADALAGQPLDPCQRDDEGDDIHKRALERIAALGLTKHRGNHGKD